MSSSKRMEGGQVEEKGPQLTVSEHVEGAPPLNNNPEEWNELWASFDFYYKEYGELITDAAQFDMTKDGGGPSKKSARHEAAIANFLESSRTILQGLKFLGEIHPAIAVAVGAFGAVINIELIRRDNNAKAMSVKLQMQSLMCTLFQIRELRTGRHDRVASVQLSDLMKQIADDILLCGNDLSYYQDKKLISRLIHANFFQDRLASHIATFAERRSQLNLLLTLYTTKDAHLAVEAVSRVESKVEKVAADVTRVLHELDSSREKEAKKFIAENGGIKKCINDDSLLEDLLCKTGDDATEGARKTWKTQLLKELEANVEDVLKKNMTNFEGMLRIQHNNIQHMAHLVENQTSQIMRIWNEIALMYPGMRKHVLLTDPMLQMIWKEMGLRQSVRAKKFVLTFKDYHIRMNPPKIPTILASPNALVVGLPPSTDLESSSLKPLIDSESFTLGGDGLEQQLLEDEWALEYIDVVHLDPIVEAIDDDFSGFISIHEANRFAVARPKGWGLLRWFAYWAAGWGISIKRYKDQIYKLVQAIFEARLDVLPCNWIFVGNYIDSPAFKSLDSLLRSTQPHIEEHDAADPRLRELILEFEQKQEERLLSNLKDIKYHMPSTDKVTFITGPGRIERFAFPLIYLLLKHHLRVIRLSSHYRLCSLELPGYSSSLLMVLNALRQRGEKLEAIFRQKSRNTQDQFKKFSFGMFERFSSPEPYAAKDNSLLTSYYESGLEWKGKSSDTEPLPSEDDLDALKYLLQDLDHEEDRPEWDYDEHSVLNNAGSGQTLNTIAGRWTGLMSRDTELCDVQKDLLLLRFDFPEPTATDFEGSFEGRMASGESISGKLRGKIERAEPPTSHESAENDNGVGDDRPIIALSVTMAATSEGEYRFRVTPVEDHSLHWKGEWVTPDSTGKGLFDLLRVPHDGIRFRHILEDALALDEAHSEPRQNEACEYSTDSAAVDDAADFSASNLVVERSRKLALARWRYAGESIRHQVQRQLWSMSYFEQMADERRRWITASMKLSHEENTTAEMRDYLALCSSVYPNVLAVWHATAEFYLERQVGESITSSTVCDSCRNQYCFLRHICITCCLNDQVDLCEECIDAQDFVTIQNFNHRPSHTLLKTGRRIPKMELSHLIPQARIRSKRVKASFRSAGPRHHGTLLKQQERQCACCDKEIHLPCWVCAVCTLPRRQDTLICMECESDKQQKGKHDASHYLLRINDSVDVEGQGPGDSAEKYFNEAKSMLSQLETKIENRMDALLKAHAEKTQQRSSDSPGADRADVSSAPNGDPNTGDVTAVARRLDNLETQVSSRFESLEAMLQRIIEAVDQGK